MGRREGRKEGKESLLISDCWFVLLKEEKEKRRMVLVRGLWE